MRKNIAIVAAAAFASLSPSLVHAATPGVNDYVTAVRIGTGNPNCPRFQTANGGGDTEHHTWVLGAQTFGMGVAGLTNPVTGVTGLPAGSVSAAGYLTAILNSRMIGTPTGPFIQFGTLGAGAFSECASDVIGVGTLDQ
jgi:hypothetical protein